MIFALAGNQSSGKTTLFNALTGANQHVGNFPGVTVEQKSGRIRNLKDSVLVDLPGIYSLRPYTNEEIVARDFIINQHPDGIINILDATNIERNLYLTLQLLELQLPMVVALNMMDELRGNGGSVDVAGLSAALGVPVVPICAAKGEGVAELAQRMQETARSRQLPQRLDFCPDGPVHRCIHSVAHQVEDHARRAQLPPRFAASRLSSLMSTAMPRSISVIISRSIHLMCFSSSRYLLNRSSDVAPSTRRPFGRTWVNSLLVFMVGSSPNKKRHGWIDVSTVGDGTAPGSSFQVRDAQ